MRIAIIGAGRVGSALAIELNSKGYEISAIVDKKKAKARKLSKLVRCKVSMNAINQRIAEQSDLLILSIKDSDLISYYEEAKGINFKGKVLAHTSGLLSSEIFNRFNIYKKDIASFHPAQTFARISDRNNRLLRGIYFGIEGGERASLLLKDIAKKLGSDVIVLNRKNKALYHLGCVISSNFLIANFYILREFSNELGISERKFLNILKPLFTQTAENIHEGGVIGSLTGPIARGDLETIQAHINLLHGKFPKFVEYYKTVSRILSEAAAKQNNGNKLKRITDFLSE